MYVVGFGCRLPISKFLKVASVTPMRAARLCCDSQLLAKYSRNSRGVHSASGWEPVIERSNPPKPGIGQLKLLEINSTPLQEDFVGRLSKVFKRSRILCFRVHGEYCQHLEVLGVVLFGCIRDRLSCLQPKFRAAFGAPRGRRRDEQKHPDC
jgi:hypothetical protein